MTIDEKYIDKLCLPNISKVKDGVYRFRCVFCSLNETNPNKWKGCDERIESRPVPEI